MAKKYYKSSMKVEEVHEPLRYLATAVVCDAFLMAKDEFSWDGGKEEDLKEENRFPDFENTLWCLDPKRGGFYADFTPINYDYLVLKIKQTDGWKNLVERISKNDRVGVIYEKILEQYGIYVEA